MTFAAALVAAAPAPGAAQVGEPTKAPKENASVPVPRRGFNVVLLLGDMQGADVQDNIPIPARKALSDMRDFLPYKNYRLLDTQWIIGASSGPAVTRLRGVEEQEYELELRASPLLTPGPGGIDQRGLSVRFVLRDGDAGTLAILTKGDGDRGKSEAASAEISREIFQLERERDDLQLRVSKGRKQVEIGTSDPDEVKRLEMQLTAVMRRISDLKQSLSASSSKAAGRTVIDTSFRMDDGETVVVGTSKVKGGGKALIALLTATADRPKSSPK